MFISVDLPAPFSPTRPSVRPGDRAKLTLLSTRTPAKDLSTTLTESNSPRVVCVSLWAMESLRTTNHEPVPQRIHQCREQNHRAFNHRDAEVGEVEQVQTVVDQLEEQHAKQRPDDFTFPAEQARAADDRRTDDVEQD